jgi:hypothetical protein
MPRKVKRLTAKKKTKNTEESPWVKHVRACMKKRNISYKQAVKDTDCRKKYYSEQLKQKLAHLK